MEQYLWERQPEAEALVIHLMENAAGKNRAIRQLSHDLEVLTSTRLFDWIDHVIAYRSEELLQDLEKTGFEQQEAAAAYRVYFHPGAQLPRVVVKDPGHEEEGVAVKVDSIADFLSVRRFDAEIEGSPCSHYRRALALSENGVSLWAIERRGTVSIEPEVMESGHAEKYLLAKEKWNTRPRSIVDEEEAMNRTLQIADEMVRELGVDMAAWIALEGEREYWEARNGAGQLQKNRQDRIGMGWANHDHHTFRSSRKHFPALVRLFEVLGFHCRERFYAGEEAGWGAQVMENSRCGLVLFLDLDLSPEEVQVDFAHEPIPEGGRLGTVGLWCALHGDSILHSGMHHLEAQFLFEELKDDLSHLGVGMMDPFSQFSYLKQAFTHGEVWQVDPERVERLFKEKKISAEEKEKFLNYGAVGSHMENLQRREGYKGFNQKNVSMIITKTDPRKLQL